MVKQVESQSQSMGPRDRFNKFTVMASAEITLLSTILLIFIVYSLGQSLLMAAFCLLILLFGSVIVRRGMQEAQIVLMISLVVLQFIIWLNAHFRFDIFGGIGPEILPPIFILFDGFLVFSLLRLGSEH